MMMVYCRKEESFSITSLQKFYQAKEIHELIEFNSLLMVKYTITSLFIIHVSKIELNLNSG